MSEQSDFTDLARSGGRGALVTVLVLDMSQPKPGWHEWTTPTGRTYVQLPYRYPV